MDVMASGSSFELSLFDFSRRSPCLAFACPTILLLEFDSQLCHRCSIGQHDGGGWSIDLGRLCVPGGQYHLFRADRRSDFAVVLASASRRVAIFLRPMKYRWSLPRPQPDRCAQTAAALNISPLLAQCLHNRGFEDPSSVSAFLGPRLKHLADPFLLPNMESAVNRLLAARERRERVVIFGDYDVDGVTSTALLLEVLRALGWVTEY